MQKPPYVEYDPSAGISTSPDVPAPNDNWQARRELAAALRRLNCAALTSEASTELLKAVTATIEAEATRVEANERRFGRKAQTESIAAQQEHFPPITYEISPAIGRSNAAAPPMSMWQADGRVHAQVTADWAYEGPFGHLHGGVVALLFDELLGTGALITGGGGFTGTLTIRYHHLTPLNKPLRLIADVDRVEGRKKFMVGELWADDVCTASCEGVFIAPRKQPDSVSPDNQTQPAAKPPG